MDIPSIYILGSTMIPIFEIHLFYSLETRIMAIKLVVGRLTLSTISGYQTGFEEDVKKRFWGDLDEVMRGIPTIEKLFIVGDFNGHIKTSARGHDDVHEGFDFGDRNEGGASL